MLIAVASKSCTEVDQHFGHAECVFRRIRPLKLTGKRPPFRWQSDQRSGDFGQCRERVAGWDFYSVMASAFRSSDDRFLRIDSPLISSL